MIRSPALLAAITLWLGVTAAVSSWLTPPFQSPDERHHVGRAYTLARGQLTLTTPEGGSSGAMVDVGLLELMDAVRYLDRQKDVPVDPARATASEALRFRGERKFYAVPGTGYYLPLIYTPQALAFLVGESLDLTVAHSYALARWLALLCALLATSLALSWLAPNPLVLGLLAMPLFAFQLGSAAIDGLSTGLALLYVAALVRAWRTQQPLSWAASAALVVTLIVVGGARPHLFPLAFLPAVLSVSSAQRRGWALSLTCAALLAGWCAYGLATTVDLRVERGATPAEIVRYYLVSPLELISVLVRTLTPDRLFSWVRSFIGLLGGGEFRVKNVAFVGAYSAIPALAWCSSRPPATPATRHVRWRIWALSTVCGVLVLLMMLATWTKHPASVIQGVAGRYFWVPALVSAAAVGLDRSVAPLLGRRRQVAAWVLPVWALMSFGGLVSALVDRYVR